MICDLRTNAVPIGAVAVPRFKVAHLLAVNCGILYVDLLQFMHFGPEVQEALQRAGMNPETEVLRGGWDTKGRFW